MTSPFRHSTGPRDRIGACRFAAGAEQPSEAGMPSSMPGDSAVAWMGRSTTAQRAPEPPRPAGRRDAGGPIGWSLPDRLTDGHASAGDDARGNLGDGAVLRVQFDDS